MGDSLPKLCTTEYSLIQVKRCQGKENQDLLLLKKILEREKKKTTQPLQANWTEDLKIFDVDCDDDGDGDVIGVDGCSRHTAENEEELYGFRRKLWKQCF